MLHTILCCYILNVYTNFIGEMTIHLLFFRYFQTSYNMSKTKKTKNDTFGIMLLASALGTIAASIYVIIYESDKA